MSGRSAAHIPRQCFSKKVFIYGLTKNITLSQTSARFERTLHPIYGTCGECPQNVLSRSRRQGRILEHRVSQGPAHPTPPAVLSKGTWAGEGEKWTHHLKKSDAEKECPLQDWPVGLSLLFHICPLSTWTTALGTFLRAVEIHGRRDLHHCHMSGWSAAGSKGCMRSTYGPTPSLLAVVSSCPSIAFQLTFLLTVEQSQLNPSCSSGVPVACPFCSAQDGELQGFGLVSAVR